jgi:KDO2-lipid IV(A) lauroyltransferase
MIVSESVGRDGLRLIVWFPLRWMLERLSFAHCLALLRRIGDLHCMVSPGKRRKLAANYHRLCRNRVPGSMPPAQDVIREYFRNHYIDHLMIFRFPGAGQQEIFQHVELEGLEHLDHSLKRGHGAILVHGHFGPVHLPLVSLGRKGYSMMQITMPSDEGLSRIGRNVAFRYRLQYESRFPAEMVDARSFLRPVIRWLAGNGVVMITGDGSGTSERAGKHEIFPFFGFPVAFPLGPARLARKTGAELLPLFIVPEKTGSYRVVIEPPIPTSLDASGDGGVVGAFIERLENYIVYFPGFMHFLDRFEMGRMIETPKSDAPSVC